MGYFTKNINSPLGMMDVRLKMAIGFAVSLLVILVDTVVSLSICAFFGICCFILCFPNLKQVALVAVTIGLMIWGLMFSQGIFYDVEPKHVLFSIVPPNPIFKSGLNVYAQGIYHGLIQSLRIIAASLIGFAICFSTEPDKFLCGLLSVKIPFSISFMAVSAIRFIPVMAQEITTVRNAMRLKGYSPFKRGIRNTVRSEISVLRPVLAGTIRRSQEIALSIQTRGFSISGERTYWIDNTLTIRDKIFLVIVFIVVLAVVVCKAFYWLYQCRIFYSSSLRPLYSFVRSWM